MTDGQIERRSVLTVQYYLRTLHRSDQSFPLINPDGIYGEETRAAVTEYQRRAGMPQTGVVDFSTWENLKADSEKQELTRSIPLPLYVFSAESLPLAMGCASDSVYILQAMMNLLAGIYSNFGRVDLTGRYDAQTADQVKAYQRLFQLNQTGIVDLELWNRLSSIAGARIH